MKRLVSLLAALFATAAALSAQERIDLWEGVPMPNSRGIAVTDLSLIHI